MRLIAWSVLAAFCEVHPETRVPLLRWRTLIRAAHWKSMDDVRLAVPKVKVLNADRARFEIAGGNFRLIVSFDFSRQISFIKFIGTHAEMTAPMHSQSLSIEGAVMDIHPIRNDDDHSAALKEIERLWGAANGTDDGDKLDILATLVERYEETRWPAVEDADPIDLLNYAIDELGHSQVELAELFGSRSRASEVLNRRRPLTVEMIRKISEAWKIPADLLVKPIRVAA